MNRLGFIKVVMAHRISKLIRVSALILAAVPVIAQPLPQHYILFLEDAPVAQRIAAGEQAQSATARNYQQQIEAKQQSLKNELASRNFQITGSVSTVLNAVFVVAPKSRLDELKNLPGVAGVVLGRRYHLNLNRATALVNAPAAWAALGGIQNAGSGMKIAMIDTGIDQTHPAFQDSSLTVPAGFPICKTAYPNGTEVAIANCSAWTNNKVIVARSYVPLDAAGSDPNNPAPDSTPDDYTPRDRVGHGTGTASAAAGVSNTGPTGITFNGVAPKAFLGNYKVFGSPEVNDGAADDAIIQAVEDALADGMDIASLSLGGPPTTGPLDTGAACGASNGVPCDPLATAVNNAVQAGMLVVIAAGNDGDGASSLNQPTSPTLNTIESPGYAPLAIAVGSTTNSHYILDGGVKVVGSGVPSNLQQIPGMFGDGPPPPTAAAVLKDVTQLGDNGLACGSPFAAGSLTGSYALIERGSCNFTVKVSNAQNGGAVGVVFYMADQSAPISPACQGPTSDITCIMISNSSGVALKSYVDANPAASALIAQGAFAVDKSPFNTLSLYSSLGPTTGDNAIKPDLVATGGSDDFGTDIYLAAQDYDPLGGLYDPSRYSAGSGTSFATPLVSGAAALVKQLHPKFSPAQIKSALVNSASQVVTSDENGDAVGVQQLGAGLLDANAGLQSTISVNPSNISFGVPSVLPVTKSFQITNGGSSSASLTLAVTPVTATGVNLTLNQQSLTLAAGASATVGLTLAGSIPSAGSYSGFVTIQIGTSMLRVPYMFLVGSGGVSNIIALSGPADTTIGQDAGPIIVKLIDANGVPVSGATIAFTAGGGASLQSIQSTTNSYGIASAEAFLGSELGNYSFGIRFGRQSYSLTATALAQPTITASGVVDGASFLVGKPIAPGSYITIFGSDLAGGSTDSATTSILPLAIDFVTVSFDVPSAQLSLPGHLVYVSDSQVNVQVPWELQGQSSVQIKVSAGDGFGVAFGNVVTVPLAEYAPAFFEIGGGQVAALDLSSKVITTSNPAQRGQIVELFANSLGLVSNQPASGDPAPTSPLAMCSSAATVTIGSQTVPAGFCGLAPGFPGLYQVNATIPTILTPGTYPITVSIGGQTSPAASIAVR